MSERGEVQANSAIDSRFYLEGCGHVRLAVVGDGILWHRDHERQSGGVSTATSSSPWRSLSGQPEYVS